MKLSTPTTPKPPTPLKVLLMGQPGTRKTTLLLQFPKVHVLDCDRNLDGPIKQLNGIEKKGIEFTYDDIRVDDSGTMLDISECFDRVNDKLRLFQIDPLYKARSVVGLDSLSHVNEFIIRKILKLKNEPSMKINLWTDFASAAYTILVARLEQTGKAVVVTCHEERVTKADEKDIMQKTVVEINPLFSGKVGDNLGAFFTDVWEVELVNGPGGTIKQILKTQRTPKCAILKNSVGMPAELDITKGFSVIEPYLRGRI